MSGRVGTHESLLDICAGVEGMMFITFFSLVTRKLGEEGAGKLDAGIHLQRLSG